MKQIDVNLKNGGYSIVISDSFKELETMDIGSFSKGVIFADENVKADFRKQLVEALRTKCSQILIYELASGEENKTLETAQKAYQYLSENQVGRKDVIISLGGGVTGDTVGFIAATYLRGLKLIHIPTTLLAQVDSSIGGKTAVNFMKTKNIVGAFYQPILVYSNYHILETLPKSEIRNGIVEILVHAIIKDKKLFQFVEENLERIIDLDFELFEELISCNSEIKKAVVERDEKETGERAILNFGHTIGHAIESTYDYKYKHGECVSLGILGVCYISEKLGLCSHEQVERITNVLKRAGTLHEIKDCNKQKVMEFLQRDKKFVESKVFFILLDQIGRVHKQEVADRELIREALEWLIEQRW